jgi:hypothetical protein
MNAALLIAMVPATAALLICFAANLRAEKAQKHDVHVESAMGASGRPIAWVFAAVLSLVAASALAQEQAKPQARSVSPDGKWEFRAGPTGEEGDFVIGKAGSDQTSLVLSEEEYTDGLAEWLGRRPGYANIVWAPDSKRFAFNLQPAKGYQTAQLYQLDGDTWRKLDSVDSHAATTAPLDRSMARQKKNLKQPLWPFLTSWQVRKWIDSSTALLYAHRAETFEISDETEEVTASFFFTLKFDPAGNWKIVRTREVPAKGFEGLNKEEREEVNRLKNSAAPTPESLILSLYSQHDENSALKTSN